MNKTRVEALTDAIVAIIMTIMVLEIKVPDSFEFTAILKDLPSLFAYLVSFAFICVAWYNQHYMFAMVKRITKSIFWVNNVWLFVMSLLPVATAWAGEFLNERGPEYFYLLIFFLWSLAFVWLTHVVLQELKREEGDGYKKVENMPSSKLGDFWAFLYTLLIVVCIYFFPPSGLILTFLEIIYNGIRTPKDADDIKRFTSGSEDE